jgi:exosortase
VSSVSGVTRSAWRKLTTDGEQWDRELGRTVLALGICLAAVVVAFHYSLSTLVRTLSVDTPLAYLGLVPMIALCLGLLRARPAEDEPSINDRQVDFIIGVPLLVLALGMVILLPVRLSSMFWVWRIDMLALPLFAAGALALLFGVRTLWRVRVALLFLLLAWPLPYTALLIRELQSFTSATVAAVNSVVQVVPVAQQLPGDGSLFQIHHGAHGFPLSVASACSGVNGVVGYALMAGAFLAIARGRWWRKGLWLITGMALVWVLNVVRIVVIFTIGDLWGQRVAIDGFHPFLGLFTFGVGVLIMLLIAGRFGITVPVGRTRHADSEGTVPKQRGARCAPKLTVAVVIVVATALLAGLANASLKSFDPVADSMGQPRLQPFLTHPGHPAGWREFKLASYDWVRTSFGPSSNWYRYEYTWDGHAATDLHSDAAILADVISTTDVSRFSTFGIEQCYGFHGYKLESESQVDLGTVVANLVTYHNNSTHSDWTTLYWHWPVKTPSGTRYERVVLQSYTGARLSGSSKLPSTHSDITRSLGISIAGVLHGTDRTRVSLAAQRTRDLLTAFATELVKAQPAAPKS